VAGKRVLAIFAHPDDETIVAGGTLAACAAAGADVVVISVTRGELGPIADSSVARDGLGAARERELHEAARELSLKAVEVLDVRDGVITFGPEGLYWHPDHVAVHRRVTAALTLLAAEGQTPWVYHATWPDGLVEELVAAMHERGLAAELWGLHPSDFGAPRGGLTTTLDVRPFLGQKLRALRRHRSQLGANNLFAELPDDLADEFLGDEYFVRAQPREAAVDWLEALFG
jgi:LmbE family N-acetylglucosaminyl deacetylase